MVDMAFDFDSKLLLFLLDVVLVNPWQRKSWFSCNFVNQAQDQVQDSIQEKGSFGFFNYHSINQEMLINLLSIMPQSI